MGSIKDQIIELQEMKIFDSVKVPIQINDLSYDKNHDIPEGIYLVQVVDIKCQCESRVEKGGRKTAQKSRECKYVANKSHNPLLRCMRPS